MTQSKTDKKYFNEIMQFANDIRMIALPASDVLLKKARFLYRNQEIGWIEALAAFQEKHGDCLALDGKDAAKALEGLRPLPVDGRGIRTICKQYTRGGRMKKNRTV